MTFGLGTKIGRGFVGDNDTRGDGLAHIQNQRREGEFGIWRELIYDPREWKIGEGEAIPRMQAEELDRLIAAGKISEINRGRVNFIVTTMVGPNTQDDEPPWLSADLQVF